MFFIVIRNLTSPQVDRLSADGHALSAVLSGPRLASIGHHSEGHAWFQHVLREIAELHSRRRRQDDVERLAVYFKRHARHRVVAGDLPEDARELLRVGQIVRVHWCCSS